MPLDCRHCGAVIKNQGARFCEFCGTEIVREEAPRTPTRDESRRTRFELLRAHPDLRDSLAHTPEVPAAIPMKGALLKAPFLLIFVGFLVFFVINADRMGAPLPFKVVPVFMLAMAIAGLAGKANRSRTYRAAPLRREPAIVVDERTKVSGGGENSSARTTYFVTLELEDGSRREYVVDGRLAGDLAEDDAGVAFVKHDVLIDFRRLAV